MKFGATRMNPTTEMNPATKRLTTCFGGGGAFGIAYNLGVAHGLQDAGVAVEQGLMVGTSAGSWAAAALATGLGLEDLAPCWITPEADGGRRRAITSASQVWDADCYDDRVFGVALQLPFGRRTLLSAARYPIADVVAASSSLPGLTAAHRIGGARYVDGGLKSPASIDRAPRSALLVAIVPLAGQILGPVGMTGGAISNVERMHWWLRHRRPTLYIHPDARFRRYVRWLGDLITFDHLTDVYADAREQGRDHGLRVDPTLRPVPSQVLDVPLANGTDS